MAENNTRFLNPYINFTGNAAEAAEFYAKVLSGTIENIMRFKDSPYGNDRPDDEKELVMHAAIRLPDNSLLMLSDSVSVMKKEYKKGNDIHLSLHPNSRDEADRIFNGLAEGGNPTMPMQNSFWNAYFGMVTDKFGISWMINFEYPEN